MKKFLFVLSLICLISNAYGQGNVGIGNPNPDPSAVLDLTATDKGFLVPRTKVGLISSPATGLVIYDTDTNCYVLYNGTSWSNLCNPNIPVHASAYNNTVYFTPGGYVTVVDSDGNHILTSTQAAWLTNGNSGTTAGTNFAGTTDAQDFVMKSNNTEVIRATTAGAVGINQPTPDSHAILDIQSTTKGILVPALTDVQIAAITSPPAGLMVYNSTINVHQFWNGTCWANVGQTVCAFDYSVSQSHTSDCLFKSNFGSVADTLTVSLVTGTASPVVLSAAGVPAGVLVNFSNNYLLPTGTSIMTMTALPSAANGTYTITILATSGSTVRTLTYTLTVFDFAVTLTPNTSTISLATAQGGGVVASATVTIGNPSACAVNAGNAILSYQVTPSNPGLSVSFGNPNPQVPGSTTMDISSSCALQGTYQIIVTSQVGVSISTATYTLIINGPQAIHISANTNNVNLFVLAGQPTCPVVDTFIVDAGVVVGSNVVNSGVAQPSMTTGNFTAGSQIVIINNGTIAGRGGDGGDKTNYGNYLGSCTGIGDGYPGGNAINIVTNGVTIRNNGVLGGGGGGGGAGEDLSITLCTVDIRPGTGGGGGAGAVGGNGGSNGGGAYPCSAGTAGTLAAPGTGGPHCQQGPCFLSFGSYYWAGVGGDGGALGQPGNAGGSARGPIGGTGACGPGNGGAAGCGVKANGFTYVYSGTPPVGVNPTCP
ncbi:MAG: hypothetical protein JST90_11110 [Bacteroidetes bacterium]|nr:hypothetical protein [Bacteroidota bacterium]